MKYKYESLLKNAFLYNVSAKNIEIKLINLVKFAKLYIMKTKHLKLGYRKMITL
jgi:hypothetical protein